MKTLAILGAGGHGKVIADAAVLSGWEHIVFFDDAWPELQHINHWRLYGNFQDLLTQHIRFDGVIIGIGNNDVRFERAGLLTQAGANIVTICHPSAIVSPFAQVGIGTVIMAGAIINIDAVIGQHCIINTGAIIEHDVILGDCVHISPNASLAGGVHVGSLSWIGLGANVRQQIQIGTRVMLGAGAAAVRNTPDNCTLIGVPAKIR